LLLKLSSWLSERELNEILRRRKKDDIKRKNLFINSFNPRL